ncbi:MAG: acyl-CoA dehydrogenase family protein, partial [Pseudoxanthomonas sp.]
EAALALCLRVAGAVDRAGADAHEAALARVATAIGKYWLCRRAPAFVNEAQECLGGAGYVEESILPRLFRQSPLNGIWEGSGNIQCLDVLRALARDAATAAALRAELESARGLQRDFDRQLAPLLAQLDAAGGVAEAGARSFTERLALLLQAAVLLHAGSPAADLFCASRLGGAHGLAMGTLPADADFAALLRRGLR